MQRPRVQRARCPMRAFLIALLLLLGPLGLLGRPLDSDQAAATPVADVVVDETQTLETNSPQEHRKAIFETPYLCRLGKRYPWIRTFVDERLADYATHVEWRETGGNPRLIVFDGSAIKTLYHFGDVHKDVEGIIREKLEL